MPRRLPSILVLAVALAAPAGAAAGSPVHRFGPAPDAGADAASARQVLRSAEAVVSGRGAANGQELTPLLKELAVAFPSLGGDRRARARRLLARPTLGEASRGEQSYTVAEEPPHCSPRFCIHWVSSSPDAPPGALPGTVPDYVKTMSAVFEHVYAYENERLGWRPPQPDGARGCPGSAAVCMNKTDVYIADIGSQSIYGYAAPDPGQQTHHQAAYLVMDNDYAADEFPRYRADPLPAMQVTAAHEYNHVLQFGYDVAQDTWMFEATATWMEEQVYTEVDDYLQYLGPWAQLSFVPLTHFNSVDTRDPTNVKVYGDMVWNRWIERHHGPDAVRGAWESSLETTPSSFAPGAYDAALARRGSSFFEAFTQFAADTAEWRAANTPFAEGAAYPDMLRVRDRRTGSVIRLRPDGAAAGGQLPHTTFGLLDVAPVSAPRVKFVLTAPRGTRMAVALVGREGDPVGGRASIAMTRLPRGGTGSVTLEEPSRFTRITAVIVNGDSRTTGRYSRLYGDWEWVADDTEVAARVSTDFSPPSIRSRSPRPGQRSVSRRAPVKVTFSEQLANLGAKTAVLRAPRGRRVRTKVVSRSGGRAIEIRPLRRLRAGTRYRVRLARAIADGGGSPLPRAARRWSFSTAR